MGEKGKVGRSDIEVAAVDTIFFLFISYFGPGLLLIYKFIYFSDSYKLTGN